MRLVGMILLIAAILLSACQPGSQGTPTPAVPPAISSTPTSQLAAEDSFKNPVIRGDFPDPFILPVGDMYYAYATNGAGKNVQVAQSSDLVKWKMLPDAMPGLPTWAKRTGGLTWAPEVIQIGDQFVLYFTSRDKTSDKQCVGAAVSSRPDGGFKDTSDQPLVCQASEGGTIDASPFQDGEKLYLLYKNDGNCCGIPTYLYIQELAADGLSLLGEPVRLVRNDTPWEGHVVEAPTMLKHDGRYYLFFSANNYAGVEYAVGYATCESVTGPCQDAPENPILSSTLEEKPFVIGPGHQHIMQLGEQTWIVYHVWEMLPSGLRGDQRQVWLDRIEWQDGKPVILGPTKVLQKRP